MRLLYRRIWLLLATLPQRRRAKRLGLAFIDCPVCCRPFSIEEVWYLPNYAALMNTPYSGLSVCRDCQDEARRRNRETFGRDLSDPYPPGQRIE